MSNFPVINVVTDYGADNTGMASASTAINNAIVAAAAAAGFTVFIPDGTYKITTKLVLKSYVRIVGESRDGVVLKIDHAGISHQACFETSDETYAWSVANLKIDFSACGTPSSQSGDVGFSFPNLGAGKGTWLFEVSRILVISAHTSWKALSQVFLGHVHDFYSLQSRNGFWHETGTTMHFQNCFHNGSRDKNKDNKGWYLSTVYDFTLTSCAQDGVYSNLSFHIVNGRGITIDSFYLEQNQTLGGADAAADSKIIYLEDSFVSWNASHFVQNTVNVANSSKAALVRINGGATALQGVAFGGAPRSEGDVCAGGNGASTAHTIYIEGGATTSLSIAGSWIHQLDTGSGFTGVKKSFESACSDLAKVVFIGTTGTPGASAIEVHDNQASVRLVKRDGTAVMRLHHNASVPLTVLDAALPFELRDIAGTSRLSIDTNQVRTFFSADMTGYSQGNANLLAGDNVEAVGIAGAATLTNLNMYLKGVAARKATIQAAGGGTSGGQLRFFLKPDSASDVVEAARFYQDGGLTLGSPTGASKGAGTLNVSGDIYKNGTAYTNPDYVFHHWLGIDAEESYQGPIPLERLRAHLVANRRLPGISDEPMGMFARSDKLLEKLEEAYLYVVELNDKIEILTDQIAELKGSSPSQPIGAEI